MVTFIIIICKFFSQQSEEQPIPESTSNSPWCEDVKAVTFKPNISFNGHHCSGIIPAVLLRMQRIIELFRNIYHSSSTINMKLIDSID